MGHLGLSQARLGFWGGNIGMSQMRLGSWSGHPGLPCIHLGWPKSGFHLRLSGERTKQEFGAVRREANGVCGSRLLHRITRS
jgi:hypothetical protein